MKLPVLFFALTILVASAGQVHGQFIPPARFYITVEGNQVCVPYITNFSIDEHWPGLDRAILILPGGSRDITQMWDWYLNGAFQAGVLQTTFIVGVQFLLESDVEVNHLNDDVMFWQHPGWQYGDPSDSTAAHPRPVRTSSYTFMDSLVYHIAEINPQVEVIVVSGGSAGAKYTHRYAAVNRAESLLGQNGGPPMTYVTVGNGSFLYLNDSRRRVDGAFAVPDDVMQGFIPAFDRYPYGMSALNPYCGETGADTIINDYGNKWITLLIGERDSAQNSDNQPMALQGWNNMQRHVFFMEYVETFFSENHHEMIVIPNAGHQADIIVSHPLARESLFYFVPD